MNPKFERKSFVAGLIVLVSQAIEHDLIDDAVTLLNGVRVLRPRLLELDILEGWILIKRGEYRECIHLMRNLESSPTQWSQAKAMMASCQHFLKDPEWEINANEVLQGDASEEALEMIAAIKRKGKAPGPDRASPGEPETADIGSFSPSAAGFDIPFMFHLRA